MAKPENVVQYMLKLQEKLKILGALPKENLLNPQQAQEQA